MTHISTDPSQPENGYVFDLESGPELTRLIHQDSLLVTALDDQVPESLDLFAAHDALDMAYRTWWVSTSMSQRLSLHAPKHMHRE